MTLERTWILLLHFFIYLKVNLYPEKINQPGEASTNFLLIRKPRATDFDKKSEQRWKLQKGRLHMSIDTCINSFLVYGSFIENVEYYFCATNLKSKVWCGRETVDWHEIRRVLLLLLLFCFVMLCFVVAFCFVLFCFLWKCVLTVLTYYAYFFVKLRQRTKCYIWSGLPHLVHILTLLQLSFYPLFF